MTTSKEMKARVNFDWLKDYDEVFGETGKKALAWWVGTMFAQRIRRDFEFWPFFNLIGEPGAGSSSLLHILWKINGEDNTEGFDPSRSTRAGRSRMFAQARNSPVVILLDSENAENKYDHGELKNLYDGIFSRVCAGKDDNSPLNYSNCSFAGGVLLNGRGVLSSDAIAGRCICAMLTYEQHSKASAEALVRLNKLKPLDFLPFKNGILNNADHIYSTFKHKYNCICGNYSRHIQNYQMLRCWIEALNEYLQEVHNG